MGDAEQEYSDLDEFLNRLSSILTDERTVVIDEFQRLPKAIWDRISLFHPNGRLIISGSSFRIVDKILSDRSPLLGLFYPVKIPLINPPDIVKGLEMNAEGATTMAPYMRVPRRYQCSRKWRISPAKRYSLQKGGCQGHTS